VPVSAEAYQQAAQPLPQADPSVTGERGRVAKAAHRVLAMFRQLPYRPAMPDTLNLRPATRDELTQSLSFALRFNGRKRTHDADETMARITAERLVEHLERSGYVVMHKPPLGQHGAPGNLAGWIEKATKRGPRRVVRRPVLWAAASVRRQLGRLPQTAGFDPGRRQALSLVASVSVSI
jgi:hypothetical protein